MRRILKRLRLKLKNIGNPDIIIEGEASVDYDGNGNVYFTHHFFNDNKMIEADIYMAERQ